MDKKFLNDYGIEKHSRFTYHPNAIEGSIVDMIKVCHEILEKTEFNRFAIMLSENNTPELVFYEGMVGTRRERPSRDVETIQPKKTFIQKLFRR